MKRQGTRRPIRPALFFTLLACFAACSSAVAEPPNGESFLEREQIEDFRLRIMSWNVWKGSIFPPNGVRRESFERIVVAIRPDVICLQEVLAPQVKEHLQGMMDRLLPLKRPDKWHLHFAADSDNVVISRYPLKLRSHENVVPIPTVAPGFHLGHITCMIDLPDVEFARDVYVVATHFASAGVRGAGARQRQADAIVRHLRESRKGGNKAVLSHGTPTVILGDLNVYAREPKDAAHHLTTLLTGNIIDEDTFGPDMAADWDGDYMVEVKPVHNAAGTAWHTWRVDSEPFPPGALDRIIYTDSVMTVHHSFVLDTTTMTDAQLSRSGLRATDVLRNGKPGDFDHLPLVVDFGIGDGKVSRGGE